MGRKPQERASWGSVQEVVKGKKYRLRYWAETPDGYRRVSETVAASSRRAAAAILSERRRVHEKDQSSPTVGSVWSAYYAPMLDDAVEHGELAESTRYDRVCDYNRFVGPRWGMVEMRSIRPVDVQLWLDTFESRNTARDVISLCRQIVDLAVRRGIVDANPFAAVRYVKPRASRKSDHGVWSYSDLCAIADAIRGQWWEPAWLLSAFGGLRVGESLGVKADEVRALSVHGVPVVPVPVLRQAHSRRRDVSDRLKTAQSRRVVPIAGPAAERLAQLAAERAGDWLTSDGTGVIVYRLTYVDAVRRFMRDSAFDDHPVRNLRNSWETYMRWEWCMNPRFTEPVMGHAVDGTTGTYYDRPSDEQVAGVFADAYKDFMARKDMTA